MSFIFFKCVSEKKKKYLSSPVEKSKMKRMNKYESKLIVGNHKKMPTATQEKKKKNLMKLEKD